MAFLGTAVFGILAIIIFLLFALTDENDKIRLNILAFPFIFLGYAFADFFAYELTHSNIGFLHSIGLGMLSPAYELLKANVIDTWVLMLYLFVFIILESYFFYAGWKISELLIPEIEEELVKGHRRKMKYAISIGIIYPLQFLVVMVLGFVWAALHFPEVIILHMILSLIFSIPISLYCIIKTDNMYSLLMAWFLWDCVIMFII